MQLKKTPNFYLADIVQHVYQQVTYFSRYVYNLKRLHVNINSPWWGL